MKFKVAGKKWDVEALRRDLQPVIERFLRELPPDVRPWFEEKAPHHE